MHRLLQCLTVLSITASLVHAEPPRGVTLQEFLFDRAPFPACHASTICETTDGLIAAYFAGAKEGAPDVGIWVSRQDHGHWLDPVEVARGNGHDGTPLPCWNPVLFQQPGGPLLLFYKVGPNPRGWWGMLITSTDAGKTWSPPVRLPDGILGPIKDKPILIGDMLLCPSSTEQDGWRVHVESTRDLGKTWTTSAVEGAGISAIQPTLLNHGPGNLQMLCRSKQGKIATSWSKDEGKTWSALSLTDLANPNSGIDAVQLKDGRSLLVYNDTPRKRSPLNVAVSDDGKTWRAGPILESEPGEYSYPAVIQSADGMVHITYTWKRQKIRHVAMDSKMIAFIER